MKYTKEDIIWDPDDLRLKDAIGKDCYGCDVASSTVKRAEYGNPSRLHSIEPWAREPFSVMDASGEIYDFTFIILKKEPVKKRVPFDLSLKEVRDALRGRWIRTDLWRLQISSFEGDVDGNWLTHGISERELFDEYVFLDDPDAGQPVGKEIDE